MALSSSDDGHRVSSGLGCRHRRFAAGVYLVNVGGLASCNHGEPPLLVLWTHYAREGASMTYHYKPSLHPYRSGEKVLCPMSSDEVALYDSWRASKLEGHNVTVKPRLASTVILLRECPSSGKVQLFVMKRQSSMAFAPGVVAFPGGKVDKSDSEFCLPWAGPVPQEWATLFHVSTSDARAVVVAAVRELFEETGVLLADFTDGSSFGNMSAAERLAARRAIAERRLSFSEFIAMHNLILRTDLLNVCSNWVTPDCYKKRYDTFFFLTRCPHDQAPDGLSPEAAKSGWTTAEKILKEGDAGQVEIWNPTAHNIQLVRHASSVDELVSERFPIQRILLNQREVLPDGRQVFTGVLP